MPQDGPSKLLGCIWHQFSSVIGDKEAASHHCQTCNADWPSLNKHHQMITPSSVVSHDREKDFPSMKDYNRLRRGLERLIQRTAGAGCVLH